MEQRLKMLLARISKAEKYLDDNSYSIEEREKYIPLYRRLLKEATICLDTLKVNYRLDK